MTSLEAVYLVPRSQVWEGSRGRAQGRVHLRLPGERRFLCGRGTGWHEREPDERELADRLCARCQTAAAKEPV